MYIHMIVSDDKKLMLIVFRAKLVVTWVAFLPSYRIEEEWIARGLTGEGSPRRKMLIPYIRLVSIRLILLRISELIRPVNLILETSAPNFHPALLSGAQHKQ